MSNTERTKEITGKISANPLVARPRRHKNEIKYLTAHLSQTEASHKSQFEEFIEQALLKPKLRHQAQVEQFNADLAKTKAGYTSQVEGLVNNYYDEIEQLNERIMKVHRLKNILVIDHHLPLPDKDGDQSGCSIFLTSFIS